MYKLYKEGQGIWARGVLATLIGGTGILASVRTYGWLDAQGYLDGGLDLGPLFIPLRAILSVLLLVPFVVAGVWLYNHPRLAEFLIDTESELKNKVTWPTAREATNNSIVVVITCIVVGAWVVLADVVLRNIKDWVYGIQ